MDVEDKRTHYVGRYRVVIGTNWERYHDGQVKVYSELYRIGEREPIISSYYGPSLCFDDPLGRESAYTALRGLTMRPGDVDAEWFDDYTPAQLEWARSSECEWLGYLASEGEERMAKRRYSRR